MNNVDREHLDTLCRHICSGKRDEGTVARIYSYVERTRGIPAANQVLLVVRMFQPRRSIDADDVQNEVSTIFSYPIVQSANDSRRRIGLVGICVFVLILLGLMIGSVLGFEPRGVGLTSLALLVGLATAMIVWLDEGAAEMTGRLIGGDGTGKYRVAGAAAAFLVGTVLAFATITAGWWVSPADEHHGDLEPPQEAPQAESQQR